MNYGSTIKELRMKLFLTQSELANLLGVSFCCINRWENEKAIPTMKMKRKLNVLFLENGVNIDEKN